jgi:hypothetical protein
VSNVIPMAAIRERLAVQQRRSQASTANHHRNLVRLDRFHHP